VKSNKLLFLFFQNINDIAWVHGYPYLLAVGHHALYIYESSIS